MNNLDIISAGIPFYTYLVQSLGAHFPNLIYVALGINSKKNNVFNSTCVHTVNHPVG